MRIGAYAGVSVVVAVATVLHAWQTRVDYYPTVVFLTTNKLAQVTLGNLAVVVALLMGKLFSRLFLGRLRDIEVEVMYEKARYAITETCLALTVFRGDLTAVTIALFTQLLFVKAFHWLSRARVEHLEQAGGQSVTSMARLSSLMFLNLVVDGYMVVYCLDNFSVDRPSVLILFAFEYAILSVAAFAAAVHLILHVIDSRMTGAWHGKATAIMLLEFFSEVFKFSFYMIFFLVMFALYGVPPLHLIRDVYMSFDQLQRRLQAFYRYRQLAATMDERFPAATEEELAECEHTCIICRDSMTAGKKLPCGHIFHFQCLRLWLQQQQACPTCRANIPSQVTSAAAVAAGDRAVAAAAAAVAEAAARGEVEPGAEPVAVAHGGAPPLTGEVGGVGGGVGAGAGGGGAVGIERMVGTGAVGAGGGGEGEGGGGRAGAAAAADAADARRAAGSNPIAVAPSASGGGGGSGEVGMPHAIDGVLNGRGVEGPQNAGSGGGGGGGGGLPAPGFAGLLGGRGGGGGGDGNSGVGVLPAGVVLHAVVVDAPAGAAVRKAADPRSPVSRTEPAGAVLLLMGPPSSCGSFCVYGGWVGGPGREGDARLVDIAQPSNSPTPDGGSRKGGVAESKTGDQEGVVEMLDGPEAVGAGAGDAAGREGLRQRVVAGGGGGGGGGGGQN